MSRTIALKHGRRRAATIARLLHNIEKQGREKLTQYLLARTTNGSSTRLTPFLRLRRTTMQPTSRRRRLTIRQRYLRNRTGHIDKHLLLKTYVKHASTCAQEVTTVTASLTMKYWLCRDSNTYRSYLLGTTIWYGSPRHPTGMYAHQVDVRQSTGRNCAVGYTKRR